jgi:hypothetical protein
MHTREVTSQVPQCRNWRRKTGWLLLAIPFQAFLNFFFVPSCSFDPLFLHILFVHIISHSITIMNHSPAQDAQHAKPPSPGTEEHVNRLVGPAAHALRNSPRGAVVQFHETCQGEEGKPPNYEIVWNDILHSWINGQDLGFHSPVGPQFLVSKMGGLRVNGGRPPKPVERKQMIPKAPTRTPSPVNFSFVMGPGGFPISAERKHIRCPMNRGWPRTLKHQLLLIIWGRSNVFRTKKKQAEWPIGPEQSLPGP